MLGSECLHRDTQLHSRIPVGADKLIMFQFDDISFFVCNDRCHSYQFARLVRKKHCNRENTVSLDHNLNAAAVALSQKDINTALKYMEKADHTTAEFLNNTGVYNFLNGDIQRATAAFEQAAKLGNEAAQANLKQLQQIMNMKMSK